METKYVRMLNVQNPPRQPRTTTEKDGMSNAIELVAEPVIEKSKTRKQSDREKINAALGQSQVDKFIEQEQKRARRWQIDQNGTLFILVALTVVSFLGSAILVANGTVSVAQFMILGAAWMGYMVFASIEVAILALMLLYLLIGSRPDEDDPSKPGKAGRWFVAMSVFVAITIISQVFHTIDGWEYAWTEPRMWVGVLLSVIVPLSYVLISKGLSTAVFARAIFLSPRTKSVKRS